MAIGKYAGLAAFGIAAAVSAAIVAAQFPDWQGATWRILGLLVACTVVTGAYIGQTSAKPNEKVSATVILYIASFLMGGLVVVTAHASSVASWAATVTWSLACLGIGGLAGFVFGVPRSRSVGQRRPPATPIPAPTNAAPAAAAPPDGGDGQANAGTSHPDDASPIEQISDWLTKTMVGVGLVDLRELPNQLDRWAVYVAGCTGQPGCDPSFALGLIIYFLILGFMGVYLLTQMFLFDLVNKFRT